MKTLLIALLTAQAVLPAGYTPSSAFMFQSLTPDAALRARLPYYEKTLDDPAAGWGLDVEHDHVVVVTWDLGVPPMELADRGRVPPSAAIRAALARLQAWGITVPPPPAFQAQLNPAFKTYEGVIAAYEASERAMREEGRR